MKTTTTAVFVLVIAVYTIYAQQTQSVDEHSKITVNGDAIVKVQPDQIIITFG